MKNTSKTILLICFFTFNILLTAQNTQKSINNFKQQTSAIVSINSNNNIAEFIRFPVNKPLILQGKTLQDKAFNFLNQYKSIYKLSSINNLLGFKEVKTDNYGLKKLILKQVYNDVPVYDAELRFHFNKNDELTAINGNYIPSIKLNSTPTLSQSEANTIALRTIENQHINNSGKPLRIFSNTLYVFQKGLVQGYNGGNHLVYEVEVRNDTDVREFLYIDAHNGTIVEQFTGIAHAVNRILYETNTSTITWQEGDAFPGSLDQWQQNEVVVPEHVYNFFNNAFGYISYDNADAQMKTINNDPGINCPNANWNGVTANYCTGTASDDVVAHEWAHAYTQYTSNLVYKWQSGAMNESFSDIWGETIDLINNYQDVGENLTLRTGGCGSSLRWMMGEDATAFGGAIRDMWDPTCKGNPGKVTDTQYVCSPIIDNGGVHTNSGVPNHAYALLVDGGTYNGQTINALGFVKTAHIFWRAQSNYLTATSDFFDLANALEASCSDLIGINLQGLSTTNTPAGLSGQIITVSDLAEVTKAILAVELRIRPSCYIPILSSSAALCSASTSNPIFYEDWESGIGSWTVTQLPVNAATWQSRDWVINNSLPGGRLGSGIFGADPAIGDCSTDFENGIIRLESPVITIPNIATGIFEMSFNHYIATESTWDGGNLKYSLGGGSWAIVPSASFTTNTYNNTLKTTAAGNDNPLAGEKVFTGTNYGSNAGSWGQSTIDLSSLGVTANSTIQFRWEMGTDGCNGNEGWYLDEIIVYNCSVALSVEKYDKMIEGVNIYPNPTNGIITLQKTAQVNLEELNIFDINGRLLKTFDVSNVRFTKNINIDDLASGIYFITVSSKNSKGSMKLIKQ